MAQCQLGRIRSSSAPFKGVEKLTRRRNTSFVVSACLLFWLLDDIGWCVSAHCRVGTGVMLSVFEVDNPNLAQRDSLKLKVSLLVRNWDNPRMLWPHNDNQSEIPLCLDHTFQYGCSGTAKTPSWLWQSQLKHATRPGNEQLNRARLAMKAKVPALTIITKCPPYKAIRCPPDNGMTLQSGFSGPAQRINAWSYETPQMAQAQHLSH